MREYVIKFTQSSKNAPKMDAYSRDRMSKFMKGVAKMVDTKCHTLC